MSILFIGIDGDLATVLARRLVDQDDEVRILVVDGDDPASVPDAPVHVASGRYLDDSDLIERACQNVRTIVLGERGDIPSAMREVMKGARAAEVSRIVYCAGAPDRQIREELRSGPIEYVILETGRRSPLRRRALPIEAVAEAIDAADDLADEVRLELDLTADEGWLPLRLRPPKG